MSANSATDPVSVLPNIHDEIDTICEKLGIKSSYVFRLDVTPTEVIAHLFKGRDGTCEGPRYVIGADEDRNTPLDPLPDGWGEAATETLTFAVRA